MKYVILACVGMALGLAGEARAVVLYDGVPGNPPPTALPMNDAAWGWFYGQTAGTNPVTTDTAGTVIDTTVAGTAGQAGFNSAHADNIVVPSVVQILKNPNMPVLDRTAGYRVLFSVDVNAESHSSADRAGFSVIVQSSDKLGVELGFWTDHVWAYDFTAPSTFTHSAEDAAFGTNGAGTIPYELTVVGSGYTLKSGASTLLSGSLRDYSARGFPYTTPDWIFMGDDTAEGASSVVISHVEVTGVPEPGSLGVLGLGALVVLRRRRA